VTTTLHHRLDTPGLPDVVSRFPACAPIFPGLREPAYYSAMFEASALDSDRIPSKLFVERIESWHLRCVKFAQHQQFPVSACLALPLARPPKAIRPFLGTPFQAGDDNDTLRIGARSIADHEIRPAMWLVLAQLAYCTIHTPLCIYQFPNRTISLPGGM
jgi:hypothetical protein